MDCRVRLRLPIWHCGLVNPPVAAAEQLDSNGDAQFDRQSEFVYGGDGLWQLYMEHTTTLNGPGTADDAVTAASHVYGLGIDELLESEQWSGPNPPTRYYPLADDQLSVLALWEVRSNGTRSVAQRLSYGDYGNQTVRNPNGTIAAAGIAAALRHGYTGRLHDATSGLTEYRHRWMNPAAGTFLQRDPLGDSVMPVAGLSGPIAWSMAAPATMYRANDMIFRHASSPMGRAISTLRPMVPAHLSGLIWPQSLFQYQDGMNIYQYVQGSPMINLDPYGTDSVITSWLDGIIKRTIIGNVIDDVTDDIWAATGADGREIAAAYWGGFAEGAVDGAAAAADGAIYFVEPFADAGVYNPCDSTLQLSQVMGGVARDALLSVVVLNLATWARNPVAYEIGSQTLTVQQFAQIRHLSVIERGRYLVQQ